MQALVAGLGVATMEGTKEKNAAVVSLAPRSVVFVM